MSELPDAIIVGGGLAGLCCARQLHLRGRSFRLLEATDRVGGRVSTDRVEGFTLDRGFQVLLTAYPEVARVLDYGELKLRRFEPGAAVWNGRRLVRFADPWRRPGRALLGLLTQPLSPGDMLRLARLRRDVCSATVEEIFQRKETSTAESLRRRGFSSYLTALFLRPFLAGVLLDPALETSSRMFEFVFKMFAQGDTALPAAGMEAIPLQVASGLPPDRISLDTPVESVEPGAVKLIGGSRLAARAVVVAAQGPASARLLGRAAGGRTARSTSCLYFAAETPPIDQPLLVLNGSGTGRVNHLCVLSRVAPEYAPAGASLVSTSVVGPLDRSESELRRSVKDDLRRWFGSAVDRWTHLRTYTIPYAQPDQSPPALDPPARSVTVEPGLYVCGDHLDNASIHGAMLSGRRAAESVLAHLGARDSSREGDPDHVHRH